MTRIHMSTWLKAELVAVVALATPAYASAHVDSATVRLTTASRAEVRHGTRPSQCMRQQLATVIKPRLQLEPATANSEVADVEATYRNTRRLCELTFGRGAQVTSVTGATVTVVVPRVAPVAIRKNGRIAVVIRLEDIKASSRRSGCEAATVKVSAVSVNAHGAIVFHVKPAFIGVCRSGGVSVQTYRESR